MLIEKNYLAHISQDGREQTVDQHLQGTGAKAEHFASFLDAAEAGRVVGELHDIGKRSQPFQARLRGGPRIDHATAGAYECAKAKMIWAAACIAGHHGGLADFGSRIDSVDDNTLCGRIKRAEKGLIPQYENVKVKPVAPPAWVGDGKLAPAFFIRMLFSCLVDADYLDTEAFMQDTPLPRGEYDDLDELQHRLNCYIARWENPQTELNHIRYNVLHAVTDGGGLSRGLFTLTVPTGGGKTIASLSFALRHARENGLRRIIYIVPYTSIIEQNAAVFRSVLGDRNVLEHHSGIVYDMPDELNGAEMAAALASENYDIPVVVTTAVQFFESLYANKPSKCRKLHNFAKSVLVFDEAQMLPLAQLRPCVAAIAHLVRYGGASAVLCTATQPSLNDLLETYAPGYPVRELCPHNLILYEKLRRVTFSRLGRISSQELCDELSAQKQVLCVVNTRKLAQKLFQMLPEEGSFHLSTLMTPAHRKETLKIIRERLENGLPCRVVSTSLIEAGVDISFPTVYREMAGLDAIIQAAGRCNREGKYSPEESRVIVFTSDAPVPASIKKYAQAAELALNGGKAFDSPETMELYFRNVRSFSSEKLDASDVLEKLERGISGRLLPFETVAKEFRMIEDNTKTIYIPTEDSAEMIAALMQGERSRQLFRKLGLYGVNVDEQHFNALQACGALRVFKEGFAILEDESKYHQKTGLSLEASAGIAIML